MANLIFKWTNNQQHDLYRIYTSAQPFDRNSLPEAPIEVPSTENNFVLSVEEDYLYAMMEVVTSEGSVFGELIDVDPQDPIIGWFSHNLYYNQSDINSLKWEYDMGMLIRGVDVSDLGVIVARGEDSSNNKLVALDNEGNQLWTWQDAQGTVNRNQSSPVCYKDRVYFCHANNLSSLNVNTGEDYRVHHSFTGEKKSISLTINSTSKLCWAFTGRDTQNPGQTELKLYDLEDSLNLVAENQFGNELSRDLSDCAIANDSNTVIITRDITASSSTFMDQPKLATIKLDSGNIDTNVLNKRYIVSSKIKNRGSVAYVSAMDTTESAGSRSITDSAIISLNTGNGSLIINSVPKIDYNGNELADFIFDIIPRRDGKILQSGENVALRLHDLSEGTDVTLIRNATIGDSQNSSISGTGARFAYIKPYIGSYRFRLF